MRGKACAPDGDDIAACAAVGGDGDLWPARLRLRLLDGSAIFRAAQGDGSVGELGGAVLVKDVWREQFAQGARHRILADGVLRFFQANVGDAPAVGVNQDAQHHRRDE